MWWSKQRKAKVATSKVVTGTGAATPPPSLIMALEARIMFDAAVVATVADAVVDTGHAATPHFDVPREAPAAVDISARVVADSAPAAGGGNVLFIDSRVTDAASLLAGVAADTQVVYLQAGKDGLQQMADYLTQHPGANSVQIIAHGNAGDLWLGTTYLSADNLAAHGEVLADIGSGVVAGGDILIYGCYTAQGERGLAFVNGLAQLTGRDIAASDDRTGAGGDWDLEIVTGSIESVNVLSAQSTAAYDWGLATWRATNNLDSGVGSLRAALALAQNGDIVTFNSSMTVQLSSELVISKNITVDGDLNNDGIADVTLDGQYRTRVVQVALDSAVTLDGLMITRGLVSGDGGNGGFGATGAMGGGIFNAGNLTLNNVWVTNNAAAGGGGGGGVVHPNYGGAGGGGGGLGGQGGGNGGATGSRIDVYAGQAGGGGIGGKGGGWDTMGGGGGSSSSGIGGIGVNGYSNGGAGGTASNGTMSIGGGGGGSGWDKVGGAGGNAVGGIYNASTGTLKIIGTSAISNNLGAGGGGGGGGGLNSFVLDGGAGGLGVGAIWNQGGTVLITAANFSAISDNAAGSGSGGAELGGGVTGSVPSAVAGIYNNGGTLNTAYVEPLTASIAVADTALKIGETSLVTFTFNKPVTGFTNADLTIPNGTLTGVSSADGGITWTATFTPTSSITDTTNVITLDYTGVTAISDGVAGIGSTSSNNYSIDTQRPTATITMSDTALKIGDTSQVTITFSEAVIGFTNSDLTVANGSLSAVSSSDGGINWVATFTPNAGVTDTTNLITLYNTGVVDLSGNAGSAINDSNNYAIDTQRPTASIVVADTALRAGETSLVTITFSEAVSGFTTGDLTVANGTLTSLSSSDSGITWTATLTPTTNITDTTNLISLDYNGVVDLAGNAGSGTINSNNYAIDTARPTASIVVADNALKIGETSLVTITFSEAVTGFTNADLTIANGTLSAVSSSDGGVTWTATFTPTSNITNASNLISLDNSGVNDAAGNAGIGNSNSNNYAIDTLQPTAIIEVANSNLGIGRTSLVTITFSEAVTGFTLTDLMADSGTLDNLSTSDNITFTATLTPAAGISQVNNHIVLNNAGVLDTAGNAGTGNTISNAYSVDSLRPTATIVLANPTLAAGQTSLVTITFSEAVKNFDNTDLNVPNGTLSAVSSSDGGVTWTATFTPTAGIHDSSNIITLNNTGYSDLANNAGVGRTNSANFSIDTVRPTASIVVANPALAIGGTSLVTITFSEAVTGFTNQDLAIANGTLSAVSSSDGGVTWTATLTPDINITDASNVITLTNSGVQNAAGNAGSGTTESNNYIVDTVRPTATIVVSESSLSIGDTSQVIITFSEAVTGFTTQDLTVANGNLSALSSSDGGKTWTATFTPTNGITDTSNVITLNSSGVTDAAGNAGTGSPQSNNYVIDTVRPTATIVVSDPVLTLGETSQVTITFSEAVTGFTLADLSASHGSLSNLSSSDGGITWTATLTPDANVNSSSNSITLADTGIADLAGNAGVGTTASNRYSIDTSRPTASIVVSNSMLNIGGTSLVTITFSQAVIGFTNSDLTVSNGTLSAVNSSDGGITWTATFTPTSGITDATNLITLDNAGVQSLSGNAGSGTTDSNNYLIDTVRPTATIVVADAVLGIGQTSLVTITFSEAVTGFTNADLTIANGTLSAVSSSDNGITWTATFTPAAGITDTSNIIKLDNTGFVDSAGNAGTATTDSNNYVLDSQRPTATIVMTDSDLRPGETALVTITFSEAVTGFDNSDLSIANGTLSDVSSSDGGITWTATFTPKIGVTDITNLIVLNNTGITDLAGNIGTGTTNSANYRVQTQVPTATIVVADTSLKAGATSLVTITFSEAVSGFDNGDLSIANGTLSNVNSNDGGITWIATFTPTSNITDSSNLITLNNAGVANLSGNSGVGTTDSNNFAIDTALPTATIVVADNRLGIGETTTVTITFSEAVNGFDLSDISVANGVLSNLSSSDGGRTWTATLTPTAGIDDATNLIVIDTAGVQDMAGNLGASIAISNNYSLDATRPTATIVTDPIVGIGQSGMVTITFNEAVTGLDLSDFVVSNGVLSDLTTNDGGKTWTATLTPSANVQSASNRITLDTALVKDLAGNIGSTSSSSDNYVIDTVRPTSSIVVADSNLQAGETTTVTITFSEAVSGLNASDFTVANGSLSGLTSSDGGKTWTATLTPSVDVESTANLITLDNSGVQDAAGNTGVGNTASNNYAIDSLRPTATIVVADSNLQAGETTTVTITFSEAVSGLNASDFIVANGSLSGLSSSDGGKTWTAMLTPTVNVESTSNLITLNNSGVQDAAGNTGTGNTTSNNYAIDSLRPTATIVVADSNLQAGETTTVTITFSEAVSGLDANDFTVANGSLSGLISSDGGKTWTATLTPSANVESTGNLITLDNSGVQDAAGNTGIGNTTSNSYAIDSLRPTASIVVADSNLQAGETTTVTITFSEAVSGFDLSDLNVANGVLSNLLSSDGGKTWTATLTPSANVESTGNLITLDNSGVQDAAGNTGTGNTTSNSYAIDSLRPTASIVVADSNLQAGETTTVTITFSEAVSGFDLSDLNVANGVLNNLLSSDGGKTWTATLIPSANVESTANLITLNSSGVQDAAGNTGVGNTASNNYAIDSLRPTASIVVADSNLQAGETTTVSITFSEAVSGFDLSDLNVANGTLSNLLSSDGGKTWTATLTPSASVESTANLITLNNSGVQDAAGNTGTGNTTSNSYAIDSLRPTASIVVADSNLQAGETTTVTITFSEAVSGFDLSDLNVANGVLSNLLSSDGGKTWTATLTPSANVESTANLITLDNSGVQDAAGNTGTGNTTSNSYAIDSLRPTASIVVADSNLQAGETTTVTITFNEAVSGFDLSDLNVANGVLSNLLSNDGGKTWTATLTPSGNVESTANLIALNNAGVQDGAGNSGTGSAASNSYAIDTLRPTASIVVADSNLQAGETTTVTITFSEAVNGFDLSDLNVANGVLSNLLSSDGGKTWTATLTPSANVESTSNLITLNNGGVRDAAGNTGTGSTDSNNYAIDSLRPTVTISRDPGPTNATSSGFTITFSEAVSGVDAADFALLSTGSATATISSLVQVDSRTYRVLIKDVNGVGSLSLVLKQAGSGITDQAGNQLASDQSSAPDPVVVLAPVFLVPAQPSYEFTDASDAAAPAASPMHNVVLGAVSGIQEQTLLTMQTQAQEQRPAIESSTHLLDLQQKLEQLNLEPPKLHAQEPFELNLLAGVVDPVVAAQAQLADGGGLPSWLSFDPLTGVLKGKAPRGFVGTVEVRITLILEDGSSVSKVVRLQFERAPDARDAARAGSADTAAPTGKPGLHAQFSQHQRDASLQQLMQQLAAVPMAATTAVESRQ